MRLVGAPAGLDIALKQWDRAWAARALGWARAAAAAAEAFEAGGRANLKLLGGRSSGKMLPVASEDVSRSAAQHDGVALTAPESRPSAGRWMRWAAGWMERQYRRAPRLQRQRQKMRARVFESRMACLTGTWPPGRRGSSAPCAAAATRWRESEIVLACYQGIDGLICMPLRSRNLIHPMHSCFPAAVAAG